MRLTVNGKPREVGNGETMPLVDFLSAQEINPRLVAVAINGDVIPKASYGDALLRDGDTVEVVRMVGGGA